MDLSRHRTRGGPDDAKLLVALDVLVGLDAFAVLVLPGLLGYPSGGTFLLEALPIFAGVLGLLALVAVAALGPARFGLPAKLTFAIALGLLAAGNAYLWTLCVAAV